MPFLHELGILFHEQKRTKRSAALFFFLYKCMAVRGFPGVYPATLVFYKISPISCDIPHCYHLASLNAEKKTIALKSLPAKKCGVRWLNRRPAMN